MYRQLMEESGREFISERDGVVTFRVVHPSLLCTLN